MVELSPWTWISLSGDKSVPLLCLTSGYFGLQVLVADINIGYEDIVNTQVSPFISFREPWQLLYWPYLCHLAACLLLLSIGLSQLQVMAFNGTPVRNLKHLAAMVESCADPFLRFDLEYQQVCPRILMPFTSC